VAVIPPIVASAPGSTKKVAPVPASAFVSCKRVTPACTVTSMSSTLVRRMRFMRERSTVTPPSSAATCPSSDEPAPYAMTGASCSAQARTIALTSSVLSG